MIQTLIAFTLLINAERAVPLTPDLVLTERAQERAEFLCTNEQWNHQNWIRSFHDLEYAFAGENLAGLFPSNQAAHKALMQSATHRNNIINPHYTKLGVATGTCGITVELFTD